MVNQLKEFTLPQIGWQPIEQISQSYNQVHHCVAANGRLGILKVYSKDFPKPSAGTEGEILRNIGSHQNIPNLYEADESHMITQPYDERSLLDLFDAYKNPNNGFSIHIPTITKELTKIGNALDHAADRGYVHLDLKPDQIIFASNESDRPLLIDWQHTGKPNEEYNDSIVVITPIYAPPELRSLFLNKDYSNYITTRAHYTYQLGIILYMFLTGSHPQLDDNLNLDVFNSEIELLAYIDNQKVTPTLTYKHRLNTGIPDTYSSELDRFFSKAFSKNPKDRFQKAKDMMQRINYLVKKNNIRFLKNNPKMPSDPQLPTSSSLP